MSHMARRALAQGSDWAESAAVKPYFRQVCPMHLPVRDQLKYWGIGFVILAVTLWFLGDVLLPFILGAAIAYFLDPIADRLEVPVRPGPWPPRSSPSARC